MDGCERRRTACYHVKVASTQPWKASAEAHRFYQESLLVWEYYVVYPSDHCYYMVAA